MFVRFNLDQSGRVYLEQYLQFKNQEDGKWERVPVTGLGTAESLSIPIGINCGVMLIDEVEILYDHNKQQKRELTAVNCISALSVTKIVDKGERTLFHTSEGKIFLVNISQLSFIELLTKALSKFMIIKIDIDGNVTEN